MATIKIDASPLHIGKKTISVKPTGLTVMKALDIQVSMAEFEQNAEGMGMLESSKATLALTKKVESFLEEILGLSEQQYAKFAGSVEFDTIFQYVGYVVASLQYGQAVSFEEFLATPGETEEDPKSEEDD